MSESYSVYKHTSPSGKIYIGITSKDVEERWKRGNGYKYNPRFYNAILKYGWDNIKHEVLFSGLSSEEAAEKEIELIRYYHSDDGKNGYNVYPGGKLISQSTKDKMKEYWRDSEWREKTLGNMKGKTRTDAQKEHYKAARAKQPPPSSEVRRKIRETLKKKTGENANRKKAVLQIEPVTMMVVNKYPTAREAAAAVGMSINSIATICRRDINSNRARASHHFFWCYEDDYRPEDFEVYCGIPLTENGKLPRTGERNSMYKQTLSDSAKQKISQANGIPVVCIETGKRYENARLAAKEYGVTADAINKCVHGKNKTCAGLHWKHFGE